jgi:hypothetical protein
MNYMKCSLGNKIYFLLVVLISLLFTVKSFAAEVSIFGPKQYVRDNGKPVQVTDSFPGVAGEAKLIITNGDANGKNRVSSAIIKINGTEVITPNHFNQQIGNIEKPIQVNEQNTITVELRSKPGSYLTVEIKTNEPDDYCGGGVDTYFISGAVTGAIQEGVTITILYDSVSADATTNTSGYYEFRGLRNGTYIVSPSLSGHTFSPSSSEVTICGEDVIKVDFIADEFSEGDVTAKDFTAFLATYAGYWKFNEGVDCYRP